MSTEDRHAWRIGVDIGGTFTDGVLWNSKSEVRFSSKVLSTPADLSVGFLEVVQQLLKKAGDTLAGIEYLAHGTTAATNAVLEGHLAPVALVTTKGFRDVLEIARQVRPDPYDVFSVKPRPLVPRNLCFGVDERMSAEGTALRPLDQEAIPGLAEQLRLTGVRAVAIVLLHSYANPLHEQMLSEALRPLLPGVSVTVSSELAPEFREYPRTCTTVINAGLMSSIDEYLGRVEGLLDDLGLRAQRRVMQSNGGLLSFAQARRQPVKILESGPAAGLIGTAHIGKTIGRPMLISFDMGGTTAKMGLVRDGAAEMVPELEVGTENRARSWFSGACGYPVLTPSVDLVEIGAGGGSIAWVDRGGKLRVGPGSAGAAPGPACYGRGGKEATVTDANVVLGRMSPTGLLGGDLEMDPTAAWTAVRRVADELGCSPSDAALGILDIAAAAMARAARTISVERGYDPRDFALAAFGGAGPLHALQLAEELGVREVIVQVDPGIASAIGLLVSDLRYESSQTWLRPWASASPPQLATVFAELERYVEGLLAAEEESISEARLLRSLEMRYMGQSYQLTIPVDSGPVTEALMVRVADEFHSMHNLRYGHAAPGEPLEVVNVRVTGIGVLRGAAIHPPPADSANGWPVSKRAVTFANGQVLETPVFERASLPVGWVAEGPAVIEEHDSTTLVLPDWTATVEAGAHLVLRRR